MYSGILDNASALTCLDFFAHQSLNHMIACQVPDLCHRNDLVRFKAQGEACVGALAGAPHAAAVRGRHFRELDLEEEEDAAGEEGNEEMRVQPVSAARCRRKWAMGASVGGMSQVDAQSHVNSTCHALIASPKHMFPPSLPAPLALSPATYYSLSPSKGRGEGWMSLEASLMLVSCSSPSGGGGGGQSGAAAGCQGGVQARDWSPCDFLV